MAKSVEAPVTPSEELQKQTLNMMQTMKEYYKSYAEYKTIMMNLVTISRELNAIKIKETTGEIPEQE